ncbi:SET domain protein 35 [Tasmannia lanceolata]|uniref:SET domain protein 35 n=1 Tax=Tasmannia lanceolata TaxID=3420 RepID=UPI00406476BA
MEEIQSLRFKASELLLREEWKESIKVYTQFISLCQKNLSKPHEFSDEADQIDTTKLKKSLCLALSNRAEARTRLREFSEALEDCDQALEIETTHFKTLVCKGKILLNLHLYSKASDCFRRALELQNNGSCETLNGFLDRCKKLEFQSRTGAFDLSDWVLSGFQGKSPELAEYIGPIEIKRSENCGGRGLFVTKNVEAGTLLLVTKAIAIERAILPDSGEDSNSESALLVMWKNFVDTIFDAAMKSRKTLQWIYSLSTGEGEGNGQIPDIKIFRPETEYSVLEEKTECSVLEKKPDMGKILKILDVNSLTEDSISAKILGKNSDYYGVGLWILPSFMNHSCNPNARRLHIGDSIVVHASRDVKAGEEITFAYFDVLLPVTKRREMAETQWKFRCNCKRCRFEEGASYREELREIEKEFECGSDETVVLRLEEGMRRWMVKEKAKGFLRASFWGAFSNVFHSEKAMRRFGRRIPKAEVVVESVADVVGCDERVLKVVVEGLKKHSGVVEIERAMKFGRCVYGKVMKKQAMRALLELGNYE